MEDHRAKLSEKVLAGGVRSNFDEKYFLIKDILFDAVFDADSEYHVYFARKLIFKSKNLELRPCSSKMPCQWVDFPSLFSLSHETFYRIFLDAFCRELKGLQNALFIIVFWVW